MAGAERGEEVSTLLHKGLLVRISWDTQGNQRPSRYSTSAGRSPMSMVRINGNNTYNIPEYGRILSIMQHRPPNYLYWKGGNGLYIPATFYPGCTLYPDNDLR